MNPLSMLALNITSSYPKALIVLSIFELISKLLLASFCIFANIPACTYLRTTRFLGFKGVSKGDLATHNI